MLLAMVVGSRQSRTAPDRLLVATALLGLAWNVSALWIYELPRFRSGWIAAAGFSALGFLPAVVVHSVLRGNRRPQGGRTALLGVAYTASAVAAVLHVNAVVSAGQVPSVLALQLLTVCFIGMLPALWMLTRGQPGGRRAIWGVALAASRSRPSTSPSITKVVPRGRSSSSVTTRLSRLQSQSFI